MPNSKVQVKFTVDSDTASAFKAKCAAEGVSMASVVSQWMRDGQPRKSVYHKIGSRALRKKAVAEFVGFLEDVLQEEECYRDAIPEQFTSRYETSDTTCEQIAEAISLLEEAFL